jgi:two-component system sensor histidine kinase TtrS
MAGWKSALGAAAARGYNPKEFFRRPQSFHDNESMVRALLEGRIDAAVLQGCHFERLPEEMRSRLKPVEPRHYPQTKCLSTSELYPAWSLLSAPGTPPELNRRVTEALKNRTLSPSLGDWADPVSLRDVYELLLRIDDDLIHEFRPESWTELLWKARTPALLLLLALALIFVHDRLVVREVAKQTALVKKGLREKREAEQRIEAWERASVVSTMSSMVAHELKQPLSVIENYTQSLLSRSKSGAGAVTPETLAFVLGKIDGSARKAISIIEHVQGYSKNLPLAKKPVNLTKLLEKLLSEFRGNYPNVRTNEKLDPDVVIEGDEFELSICILNVLKNAAQAMKEQKDAAVHVTLSRGAADTAPAELVITDNGPGLTDEDIKRLQNPLQTSKRTGLGLGLSIVRSIAERHRGSVRISRAEPRGLTITIRLGKELKEKKKEGPETPA